MLSGKVCLEAIHLITVRGRIRVRLEQFAEKLDEHRF